MSDCRILMADRDNHHHQNHHHHQPTPTVPAHG